MAWKKSENEENGLNLEPAMEEFVTKDFSAIKMIATEDVVFIL